ncbi:hypothetical protein QEU97_06755 [Trueperella pyogenes]|uniref:hypothetical protein n=1 Tax=Trueperella pyogenes TaxID=1661 RepID=UPI0031334E8F
MNVREANKIIAACNEIAERVTRLGGQVEQDAWESFEDHPGMSGVRPIAAAQLSQPSFEDACHEHVEQKATAGPDVTLEQVRAALAGLSKAGLTGQARGLIEKTGVSKLSEVDPGKYAWLLEAAKVIADASE